MVNHSIDLRLCRERDIAEVKQLLHDSQLPYSDVSLEKITLLLATSQNKIIGCIGLEDYGEHGLLRSLAVQGDWRGNGLGSQLLKHLLNYCRKKGVMQLHLLTTTADDFFIAKGFQPVEREQAPEVIKNTAEFAALCPVSSSYLMKKISG